jgi:hypothetical protein
MCVRMSLQIAVLALSASTSVAHASAGALPVANRSTARVTQPVRGLYEAIPTVALPRGWTGHESRWVYRPEAGGERVYRRLRARRGERPHVIEAELRHGATGTEAWFSRNYEPETRTLTLDQAYLDSEHWRRFYSGRPDRPVPSWIDSRVPLVKGKGVPTVVYMTLRQMKQFGIRYGGLAKIEIEKINNAESDIDVHELKERGLSLEQAVKETGTYRYVETIATQSGHKIVGMSYRLARANEQRRSHEIELVERGAPWQGRWRRLGKLSVTLGPAEE